MANDASNANAGAVRVERSAGGVVLRATDGASSGFEVLVGEQIDWNTGAHNLRLPKGHLDPGESDEEAALREVREETGRAARIVAPLPTVEYRYRVERDGSWVEKTVAWFAMRDDGPAEGPRDDEMEAVRWLPCERAEHELSFETERQLIAPAVRALGG